MNHAQVAEQRAFDQMVDTPDVCVLADQPLPAHQDVIGAVGRRPGKPTGHCIRETYPHTHPKLGAVRMYQAWCGAYVVPARPVTPWCHSDGTACRRCVQATAWMRKQGKEQA